MQTASSQPPQSSLYPKHCPEKWDLDEIFLPVKVTVHETPHLAYQAFCKLTSQRSTHAGKSESCNAVCVEVVNIRCVSFEILKTLCLPTVAEGHAMCSLFGTLLLFAQS